jgi:hypothetical protein
VSAFLALCVNLVFPLDHHLPNQSSVWGNPSPFWDAFARHDSGWYFDIARNGYDATNAVLGGRSSIAFAPVCPAADALRRRSSAARPATSRRRHRRLVGVLQPGDGLLYRLHRSTSATTRGLPSC